MEFYKTAESVSVGHPDSCMDYIVNSILDAYLTLDPQARVAIDGVAKNKYITLGGEITSDAEITDEDIKDIIKRCLKEIGYEYEPEITLHIYQQSPDIAQGTNEEVRGAGDQGTITGYARSDLDYMPLEKAMADRLVRKMFLEKRKEYPFIKSDMKSQVTLKYNITESEENHFASIFIDTVVFACQHTEDADPEQVEQVVKDAFHEICRELNIPIPAFENTKFIINGTGKFVLGGPEADSGEVGRKIVVDAYGVSVPVGGGTYNGKDPSKVDRSAAYYARWVAKNVIASGLADDCLITVSYCIGLPQPISIDYEFFGTTKCDYNVLVQACNEIFDFTPANMIDELRLRQPIYATAGLMSHYGQTDKTGLDGNVISISWEQTNKAEELKEKVQEILDNSYSNEGGKENE